MPVEFFHSLNTHFD